ncbi:MAG: NUDIX domain-containing protein [Sulfurospirillaceae bacterium]|nr:NUDIX domain-containing protein [Sulfurospirillaceae bacterium]MDD2827929.1 NUDIX domain-containing protein [Sulfurospirillaceae bacterium]
MNGINKIEILKIEECVFSEYIKPKSMFYRQNSIEKRWDIVDTHDSVAILLYHKELDSFVFVKQFRPSIYLKNNDGFTYELCAGIVDKDKSLIEIAQEEVLEETGYAVSLDRLQKVTSFYTAVGFAGGLQTFYFATIDESMRVGEGGGIENENIEVIYLKREEALPFMFDGTHATTSGLMFALMWYFKNFEK